MARITDVPQEGDYTVTPCGPLGSKECVGIIQGPFLGEYNDWEEATRAVCQDMRESNWYPNVWLISDHGDIIPTKVKCK